MSFDHKNNTLSNLMLIIKLENINQYKFKFSYILASNYSKKNYLLII